MRATSLSSTQNENNILSRRAHIASLWIIPIIPKNTFFLIFFADEMTNALQTVCPFWSVLLIKSFVRSLPIHPGTNLKSWWTETSCRATKVRHLPPVGCHDERWRWRLPVLPKEAPLWHFGLCKGMAFGKDSKTTLMRTGIAVIFVGKPVIGR